jgi:hypothetical protein
MVVGGFGAVGIVLMRLEEGRVVVDALVEVRVREEGSVGVPVEDMFGSWRYVV